MKRRALGVVLLTLTLAYSARSGTLAQFRTPLGNLDVELYDEDKPSTVSNFVRYAQGGFYTNVFLHRCIPGFVAQGGGFRTDDSSSTALFSVFSSVGSMGPITNEFNVGRRFSNTYGTIAMAKTAGDPNSASSQWFFNLADNSANLDNQNGGFTVFGRVIGGTNVLEALNARSLNNGVVDLRQYYGTNATTSLMSDLPVTYAAARAPHYNELIYVGVSVTNLKLQVRSLGNGGREISWSSFSNRTNTVEFATNFPPLWQSLLSTNGNGGTLTVLDSTSVNSRRFYRVRVDY